MQVNDTIRELIKHSGMSMYAMSGALGHARTWAGNTVGRVPKLDTLADVADVAGVDVVLVDRSTGSTIGTIEPPRRASQGD